MKANIRRAIIGLVAFLMMTWMATAADVSGTWKGTITYSDGKVGSITFNLKEDGNKVTGSVVGDTHTAWEQERSFDGGKIEGDKIAWRVTFQGMGAKEATFAYDGEVKGNQMEGTVTAPNGHKLPFAVTKK